MTEIPSIQNYPLPVRRAHEQARLLDAVSDLRDAAKKLEPFSLGEFEQVADTAGLDQTFEDPEFPTYHHARSERFFTHWVKTDLDRLARKIRDTGLVGSLRGWGGSDWTTGLLCEALVSLAERQRHSDVARWFHDTGTDRWMDPESFIGPLEHIACHLDGHRIPVAQATTDEAATAETPQPGARSTNVEPTRPAKIAEEHQPTNTSPNPRNPNPAPVLLSQQVQRFCDLLLEREPDRPMTGPVVCAAYQQLHGEGVEESDFRSHVVPKLKAKGLLNKPRVGYYFPSDAPARLPRCT